MVSTIAVNAYCFLCRQPVPEPGSSRELYEPDNWDSKLIGLINAGTHLHDVFLISACDEKFWRRPRRWPGIRAESVAFCWQPNARGLSKVAALELAHQDCWKVANRTPRTASSMLQLAWKMKAIIPPQYATPHSQQSIPLSKDLVDTSLGRLLSAIEKRLPGELHLEIARHLHGSLVGNQVGALHMALQTSRLMDDVASVDVKIVDRRREFQTLGPLRSRPITSIFATTSNVFGQTYLLRIDFNGKGDLTIPVAEKPVSRVRFALNDFGLRAIRVVYSDESLGQWLGDHQFCWYREIQCHDLRRLHFFGDDLRIFEFGSLDSPGTSSASTVDGPSQMVGFWSREEALRHDLRRSVILEDDNGQTSSTEDWRLCPYIDLVSGGEYTSGLTVYMSCDTISGITSHTRPPQSLGTTDGHCIHFSLGPTERIVGAWVCISDTYYCGRCFDIHVTTSLGRSCYFAPINNYSDTSWTRVSSPNSTVVGLFWDEQALFGVSCAPRSPNPNFPLPPATIDRPPDEETLEFLAKTDMTFATVSRLDNVRRLSSRLDSYLAGMLVEHSDGTGDDALGNWDPLAVDQISVVYDADVQPPLEAIVIHLDWYGQKQVMSGVVRIEAVVKGDPVPEGVPGKRKVFRCPTEVMWLWEANWYLAPVGSDVVDKSLVAERVEEVNPLRVHRVR